MDAIAEVDQLRMRSNRDGWNKRASAHVNSSYYNLEEFRAGRSSLRFIEKEAVGDVEGRSFLHLQCHLGLNAISWARQGARVTAVDFAGAALEVARGLANDLGVDVRFIEANIFDLPGLLDERFDIVYTDYGVLTLLPDLREWARLVARSLRPGGVFHLVEIHPLVGAFAEEGGGLRLQPFIFETGPIESEVRSSYGDGYSDERGVAVHTEYFWPFTPATVMTALLEAGLVVEAYREVPVDCRQRFSQMVPDPVHAGCWRLPGDPIPLTFVISARRPPA